MYTLQEANPAKMSDKDYKAIIAFRKRFFYQNYANHPEPDFSEWKNKIIRFYQHKRAKGFYSIYKNEKIITNLFYHKTKAFGIEKVVIRIDHDKEAESEELSNLLCEQINLHKKKSVKTSIETKEKFISKVAERCGFYKGNAKEFAALNLSKIPSDFLKKLQPKEWTHQIVRAPNKTERQEIANIMTFLLNDMEGEITKAAFKTTAEEIEKNTERLERINKEMLYFLLRDKTAKLIGYSCISFEKSQTTVANQYMTGILPEYRRQGLAKYIKSTFYQYLQKAYPKIKVILTNYYIGNERIRQLNKAIGFQPEFIEQEWLFGA